MNIIILMSIWRYTQVWLKGSVLKTYRRRHIRAGVRIPLPPPLFIKLTTAHISGDCRTRYQHVTSFYFKTNHKV